MRIGLVSDSHGWWDSQLTDYLTECDEVWHAGDLGNLQIVQQWQGFKPFRAVFGNIDGPEVRQVVPEFLVWDCNGLKVLMTHIGGYPGRYDTRAKQLIQTHRPGLFLCGHSHILRVMKDPAQNLLHLNPGAYGHHGVHERRTALKFVVDDGKVKDLFAIDLGSRGRQRSQQKGRQD
jgi:uncharacterized protein